jgi:uncharacterized protein (TIGR03435 family)
MVNEFILEMYRIALRGKSKNGYFPPDKMLLEVSNLKKYVRPIKFDNKWFDWADSNTYCYALKVPLSQSGELYDMMLQDLDRFFNLRSGMEMRRVKCYALRIISPNEMAPTQFPRGKIHVDVNERGESTVMLPDFSMFNLVKHIQGYQDQYGIDEFTPILDETNYKGHTDIRLPYSEHVGGLSIEALRNGLHKYGLDLVEEYQTRDVFVIRDAAHFDLKETAGQ